MRDPDRHVFARQRVTDKDHELPIAGYAVPTMRDAPDGHPNKIPGVQGRLAFLFPADRRLTGFITVFITVLMIGDVGHNGSIDFPACSVPPCTS